MTSLEYDLIVIGAGAVGENVADRAVQGGLSVAIVEAELVGGDCSYWACMPSKTLLRSAASLRAARSVDGARQAVTGELDVAAVFARRDRIVHDWDDGGQVRWLEGAGIDLFRGHGALTGPKQVSVTSPEGGQTRLVAHHAVAVCTGSAALMPDIPGLREVEPWTSRDATSSPSAPVSLVILGGGVVAVEMATAYAGFGTDVTIVARSGLLSGVEDFAANAVHEGLEALGVTVRLNATASAVHGTDDGAVVVLSDGGRVAAERVLVATGRVPRTMRIGLESVGLMPGEWLDVDDTLRVRGTDWLYAVGDVNHRALLTHQGKYQARAAGDVIAARAHGAAVDDAPWGAHVATADHTTVPQVVFADPEVASVGISSTKAADEGRPVRVLDVDLAELAGSSTYSDAYRGQARAVVDTDRHVVIGATFVGPDVAELLHAATIAIVGEVPLARLWHAVPPYPTVSELWLRWLEDYGRPAG